MSNNIPIVQGVAVPSGNAPYSSAPTGNQPDEAVRDFNGVKGDPQPKKFNDVAFAILFWAHLAVMAVILSMGTVSYAQGGGGGGSNYTGLVICVLGCGALAIILSTLALSFMYRFAAAMVKLSLVFSVASSVLIGIMGIMSGDMLLTIMGFAGFAIGCCYAYVVWSRIPFAASNLRTALTAVKQNMGLAVVAYTMMFVACAWSVFWVVGLSSAMVSMGQGIIFLFLVSFYWVHQVLTNTVHVTTAGTVGTWWFVPDEASSFCSSAVRDSFVRASTYSFGSICFGSLLVAIVQALRALYQQAQNNDDCQILACIISCILACIQSIIEYLNKVRSRAFSFLVRLGPRGCALLTLVFSISLISGRLYMSVGSRDLSLLLRLWSRACDLLTLVFYISGLYGYSFLDAGRNVITLFQNKGWTTIITDDLCDNVLWLMSIGIGLACGLLGFLMGAADQDMFSGIGYDQNGGTVGFMYEVVVEWLLSFLRLVFFLTSFYRIVTQCWTPCWIFVQQHSNGCSRQCRQHDNRLLCRVPSRVRG